MPLWQSSNLIIILCHQSFLLHCLSLNCWKLLPFLESILFFSYDFKNIEYLITLVKCLVRRASNYFYCFNGITVNLNEQRNRGNMSDGHNLIYARCYSSLSTNHDHVGMPHQALIQTFYASNSWALPLFVKIMQSFILMQNTQKRDRIACGEIFGFLLKKHTHFCQYWKLPKLSRIESV